MILVTGSTGHLGNVLVRKLINSGEKVRAMVLPGEKCKSLEGLDVEKVEGNAIDPESLDRAMEGVDEIYHLAGVISIIPGAEQLMHRVNVEGAANVAKAALKAGVPRMIHTSSVHALKREPHGVIMDESTPLDPDNPAGAYDRSKAMGTLEVLKQVKNGLNAVVVCPTGIMGPYDYMGSEMGNVVMNFARKKLHFLVKGSFDFVDVRDVADGLILACKNGRRGEIYILSGQNIKLEKIREITQELENISSPLLNIPEKTAMFMTRFTELYYRLAKTTPSITAYSLQTVLDNADYSNEKARKELGYSPRSLRESIADTIKWHRKGISADLTL